MVKLEAGKYYKTRDGRKVGPMQVRNWSNKHPFICEIVPTPECSVHTAIWEIDGKNYELRNLDIVSEWVDYSSCEAAQVDVQREEYGPVKRVIRNGRYGPCVVCLDGSVVIGETILRGDEIHEAAHILSQVSEYLHDNRA